MTQDMSQNLNMQLKQCEVLLFALTRTSKITNVLLMELSKRCKTYLKHQLLFMSTVKSVLLCYTDGPSSVTLSSEDIVLKEEDMLQVVCSAECNPLCTFQWTFTDEGGSTKIVGSDSTLKILSLDRSDHGTYTCKATNEKNDNKGAEKPARVTVNCEYFIYRFEAFSQMQSDLIL